MTHEALGGKSSVLIAIGQPVAPMSVLLLRTGAAAFFAMREYEKHQAANGNPPSHAFAKELMAGIAAAEVCSDSQHKLSSFLSTLIVFNKQAIWDTPCMSSEVCVCWQVDKLIETKGMNYMDREKAKRHAKQQAEQMYDQNYGNRDIGGGGGGNWGNIGNQYGMGGGMGGGFGMQQGNFFHLLFAHSCW